MTSPSIFRSVLSTLLGFILAGYGLLRCVHSYPGQEAFAHFNAALPAVTAVGSFALAVLAAAIGVLLLLPIIFRILRHLLWPRPVTPAGTRGDYGTRTLPLRPLPLRRDGEAAMRGIDHQPADLFAGNGGEYGPGYDDVTGAYYSAQHVDERPGNGSRH